MFLMLQHREALFGGAAGGGKSQALLMAALQYVDVPGYSALLFRRTYADLTLPGALLDRARDWLGPTDAVWNDREKTWRFPSGATLTFGYLDTENDRLRYQGAEAQFVGFDELTQFGERDYRYLFSRLRRLQGSPVPIRMRAASNPGGPGHEWVKARFVDSDNERPFVPARLSDNPSLDTAEYEDSLAELDPITRRQLLEGDWTARAGGSLFRREWFKVVEAVPAHAKRVRYWDLASTEKVEGDSSDPDWTVGTLLSRTSDGTFTIEDVARTRSRPADVEALVAGVASMDGPGVPIRIEQEPGASGKAMIAHYVRLLAGYNVAGDRPSGDKRERAAPVSAQAEAGNFRMKRAHWNGALTDELEGFDGSGETGHDDQVDALSGAFNMLTIDCRGLSISDLYGDA
jgi:predicted phage terminase large subunit-like protein